jgi:hypothetical protein
LKFEDGHQICEFKSKKGRNGEHQLYWKLVKRDVLFIGDALFTENDPGEDASDARHRNHANYADHVNKYPTFHPLDEKALKNRIEYISKIAFDAPPIPRLSEFPDVGFVQVIAYHRIVRFRQLLDEVLGGKNRFWNVNRNPSFAGEFIDFQLVAGSPMAESRRN